MMICVALFLRDSLAVVSLLVRPGLLVLSDPEAEILYDNLYQRYKRIYTSSLKTISEFKYSS